jgi:chemotaxis protein MotB
MLRRKRAEVQVNHERWLVSYADFITLLFAFFVVMYSISQVNQSKYRVLSETFVNAFPAATSTQLENNQTALAEQTLNPIQVGQPALTPASSAIDVRSEHIGQPEQQRDIFSEISALVSTRFEDLINEELITVASNELWLKIELKDSILFSSGSAEPSLQAQVIFEELATILKAYPNPIQVEGYTDNIPISSARFPSNWELSSARASSIVKWLVSKGVEPTRLSAVGFGEYQPIADNSTAEGRAQNRRIALMIARKVLPRPGVSLNEAAAVPGMERLPENNPEPASADNSAAAARAASPALPNTAQPAPVVELVEEPAPVLSAPPAPVLPTVAEEVEAADTMIPIKLEDGGLLFTSDPDLPR